MGVSRVSTYSAAARGANRAPSAQRAAGLAAATSSAQGAGSMPPGKM
jgi:hypothetical protein